MISFLKHRYNIVKLWFTPDIFNSIAVTFSAWRWKTMMWSILAFILFMALQTIIDASTPSFLIWVAIFILFASLQALVFSAFIFFFKELPSSKTNDPKWLKFYRAIEWCESIIFSFILPLPSLLFIYALIII